MTNEIMTAVNTVIEATFPDVEINAKSVKEGYESPSFFVSLEPVVIDVPDGEVQEITTTARIVYFPSNKDTNAVELGNTLDTLAGAFQNNLEISNIAIADVSEFTGMIQDDVLTASFDIHFTSPLPDTDESLLMAELKYNQEVQ